LNGGPRCAIGALESPPIAFHGPLCPVPRIFDTCVNPSAQKWKENEVRVLSHCYEMAVRRKGRRLEVSAAPRTTPRLLFGASRVCMRSQYRAQEAPACGVCVCGKSVP